MRRILVYTISVIILAIMPPLFLYGDVSASVDSSSYAGRKIASRIDLRRYFEKAMSLFEAGKYKETIVVLENLIKIEKSQNESYFTPFAEIYIEKSKDRMKEMLVLEDKRWARMKKSVVEEAQRIARKEAENIAKAKEAEIRREEKMKRKAVKEAKERETYGLQEKIKDIYGKGMAYYKRQNYPMAIVEFNKIKELDPSNKLVPQAVSFIDRAQKEIKRREEREVLAKMQAARHAKFEMEREEKRRQIEHERKEKEKVRLKKVFEERLRARMVREKIVKIEGLLDTIRAHVREQKFEEAEKVLDTAIKEFPENERFKDILHYVEMQKIKIEENALKRAREITEEKMLLDVAKKHLLPEKKSSALKKQKKITPIVKVPEIRKRLKIPISVDFKNVGLDYVLSFLSDVTSVNIIPSSGIDMEKKKVTIKIKDMPLEDALRYILRSQDLVYRIEQDAVWVTTKEELQNERIETRVYFLNEGIGRFAEFTGTYEEKGEEKGSTGVKTIKDVLENAVDWPKDSKLTLDDRTGALIISNIPSNLGIIENLLYNLDVKPVQVLIEARFLELVVTDLDDLGLEWKLNSAWGLKQNNAKQNIHGFASSSGVDFSNFSRSDEGFNLTYQGILSHPKFQMVMHALKEKQDVKTLSAPRIVTLNNQIATIEVTDEYIYPTRYEVSLVQYDINGDGDFDDAGETEWANIPQDFVTRDVGILLHVKPSVGMDNKTVTLALTPEVSEQDTSTPSYTYSGSVSIPNFKTRNLSTSVIVKSGDTVVMGGLVKETNTNTKTKVPLLGDLPLVGGLFRKNHKTIERRNLLVFVTATVLNEDESVVANAPVHEQNIHEQ